MTPPIQFGTDGVRGPVGAWPITAEGAHQIAQGVAHVVGSPVLVGWDTRASSATLAEAAIAGLREAGVEALSCGVLPTPALSVAVTAWSGAAGLMITASHNPWTDNGLKVVGPDGAKSLDEAALERAMAQTHAPARRLGGWRLLPDAARPWREQLPKVDLRGRTLLLDCANGAAAPHAPGVLRALGATLRLVGCVPDGENINDGCGALHPPTDLQDADLAIALDGDGDRLALVDAQGPMDGDDLLWILSRIVPGPVVGTTMCNGGLEAALGGRLHRVAVGDRHVAEGMARTGAKLGGEPSGHLLLADGPPTACGLHAALRVLQAGTPDRGWTRWPQARRDVRDARPVAGLRAPAEAEASGHRVLVRASGTEPVVRVMVEGPDAAAWADRIARELSP